MPESKPPRRVSAALALTAAVLLFLSVFSAVYPPIPETPKPFDYPALRLLLGLVTIAALGAMVIMLMISRLLLCKVPLRDDRGAPLLLVLSGSGLLGLLLVANVRALWFEGHLASHEDEFHTKFNDLICDLRGTEVCTKADNYDKVFNLLESTVNSTSSAETSARTWDYCRANLLRSGGSLPSYQQRFLDSFNITDAVDKWCGANAMALPMNATSPFSPVSMNLGMYQALQVELPRHIRSASIFVGPALVCMALLYFVEQSLSKDEGEQADGGFRSMDSKIPQEMVV